MMLALGLSYMAFTMLRYLPSILILLICFYHEWMLNFVECFFCFCGDDHVLFVLILVNVVDDADGFQNVVPSFHPWNKLYLIMIDDLFDIFFTMILLSVFASMFTRDIGL